MMRLHIRSSGVLVPRIPKTTSKPRITNDSTPSMSSSKSFFMNQLETRDQEITSTFESPEWTTKTLDEKNQWVTHFLNRTKADIRFVLKNVSDIVMNGNSTAKDETYELLSMPSVIPWVSETDNCLRAIHLKLMKDKCDKIESELESKNQEIRHLSEQLNKNTCSQETQTHGINIEELKKSLSDTSSENMILRLELNSSNQLSEVLQRDLSAKMDELTSLSAENSALNSKIEHLNETFEKTNTQNSKQIARIDSLQAAKNKFKQDFLEAQKERDDYYESWMEFKDKYEKTNVKLQKLKSESDTIRRDELYRDLVESDLINKTQSLEKEIGEKEEQVEKLSLSVRKLEETVEKYREIDGKQLKTIKRLTANVKEMETRAQCWINRNVRDKFELKINHLEQLVDKLKTDKQLLSHEYNKTTANFSKQEAHKDKFIKKLQSHMDGQQKLINLMRKVKFDPSKFEQSSTMDSIFSKLEDEQRIRQDLEKLIQENYILQKKNTEYKKVFDSHPFKQLFVTY